MIFALQNDSPALKLGFKPFDSTQAGRTAKPELCPGLPPVPRTFE